MRAKVKLSLLICFLVAVSLLSLKIKHHNKVKECRNAGGKWNQAMNWCEKPRPFLETMQNYYPQGKTGVIIKPPLHSK